MGTPWRNLTVVEVQTDEGITGLGEARMVNHTDALLGYLSYAQDAHVVGSDPFEVQSLVQRMFRNDYDRAGAVVMSGIATVEMACWDIMGKALGQPVHRLLGGAVRERVPVYANGWYTVEREPQEFHAAAKQVVERGYRALKVDPFGPGQQELSAPERRTSIALVEAVRDAIGPDAELFVEMHGRFTPSTALSIARELEPYRPGWIEEPVPPENLKALAKVAERANVPVATGERLHTRYEFRELFELQAADIIQPDLCHFGGILELRHLAATAETGYVLLAPHNVGGPIATGANLQLAATVPNFKIQEHFNDFADSWVRDLFPGLPHVGDDGAMPVPTAPGLGIGVDWDAVAEHPREQVRFDLFTEGWERREGRRVDRA
ncbi:mandelate racemase/muconate lactonizing enzyme family protein [Conexibacter sp. CPCC 206217]|nr:mandelate racemase/muconate lactonizing enzyme family protein [Conexibacter sp. CPCC 206217]MDO8213182.1 mandelate racemase/muconate lactonizing enzyme family protein [Conexibacter sp. CPCC 206217]